ncbi:hypothetical protein KC19_4G183200 [Ceratodon purpureus]|uniref:Uncharacterized protein n=1 Tax=Ceratodon purpureus TaxID=3225 RepID=A0A8T0ICB9_CERPU|nr:hypothetical protein KC19_4G183200 [Ceratodon purpureus]
MTTNYGRMRTGRVPAGKAFWSLKVRHLLLFLPITYLQLHVQNTLKLSDTMLPIEPVAVPSLGLSCWCRMQ